MIDIYSYLQGRLRLLRRSGKHYAMAACPVHKGGMERHPSFSVNLRSGNFRCFSCGIKGTIHDLAVIIGPPEDSLYLEQALEEKDIETNPVYIDQDILYLFDYCPKALVDAGFEEHTLRRFRIGFDTMFLRITFPIFDEYGNLVAISGRSVDGSGPRYKVYTAPMLRGMLLGPEEFYQPKPKELLWGAQLIDTSIPTVVVTEGYKACMWLYQAGIPNVVATMGTNVTKAQLRRLTALADRVIIAFDMDNPGITSAQNLQRRLLELGIPTTVLEYPARQPDGLTQEQIITLFHLN